MKKCFPVMIIGFFLYNQSLLAMSKIKPRRPLSHIGKKKKQVENIITFWNKSEYAITLKKGKLTCVLLAGGSTKVQLALDQTIDMRVNGHRYEYKRHRLSKPCKKDIHVAYDGIDNVFRIVPHNEPFDAQELLKVWATISLNELSES